MMVSWEVDIRHFVEVRYTVYVKALNREDMEERANDFAENQSLGDLMAAEGRVTVEGHEIESAAVEEAGR